MHQPLYKDPFTDEYTQPWVLLHGTKDYYDMAAILDEFPDVHQTFNVVPSLIEQIRDYEDEGVKDETLRVTMKPAEELTTEEKVFILNRFFQANWHRMIRPANRYWELLEKRGFMVSSEELTTSLRYFTDEDFRDLQVLFHLVWIDPELLRNDRELTALLKKGRGYTEADKHLIRRKQTGIMKSILPKYRELMEQGTIEVTTSPFYHPILPLLCDTESAREAEPHIILPSRRFMHPEDARTQLRKAVELHQEVFGAPPRGLWPSEGSVSMELLPLIKEAGIEWIATDEEVLAVSIDSDIRRDEYGHTKDPFIYRPYSIGVDGGNINIVFRDHRLSDLIGFDYASWDPERAADDLVSRLNKVHHMIDDPQNHLVSIILDGENAWETYSNDGRDFLYCLYSKLSHSASLKCVTIGEFLSKDTPKDNLPRVVAGSWINHNFRVWIGHKEDNTAWDHISKAREALVLEVESAEAAGTSAEREGEFKEAWEALYAAEGSDWFWWYGDIHSSDNDDLFDSLFRRYVTKVYKSIGKEPPISLEVPIISKVTGLRPSEKPVNLFEPLIDGEVTNYFEWLSAGRIELAPTGAVSGAMHTEGRCGVILDDILYGFDLKTLYMRFDYLKELSGYRDKWNLTVNFLKPTPFKVQLHIEGAHSRVLLFQKDPDSNEWVETLLPVTVASGDVVELAVPFRTIGAASGDELHLMVEVDGEERGVEKWPVKGFVIIDLPTKDFGKEEWSV